MDNATQYYRFPFADSGTKDVIPDESVSGAVGFDTGYGPDYELEQGAPGRKRIPRGGHNGILNGITENLKQWQEANFPTWIEDAGEGVAFAYPEGVIVSHNSLNWVSLVDANTAEPVEGANWAEYDNSEIADAIAYQNAMRARTWQNVTASRVVSVVYTNSEIYPIQVIGQFDRLASQNYILNGESFSLGGGEGGTFRRMFTAVLQPSDTISIESTFVKWMELR